MHLEYDLYLSCGCCQIPGNKKKQYRLLHDDSNKFDILNHNDMISRSLARHFCWLWTACILSIFRNNDFLLLSITDIWMIDAIVTFYKNNYCFHQINQSFWYPDSGVHLQSKYLHLLGNLSSCNKPNQNHYFA